MDHSLNVRRSWLLVPLSEKHTVQGARSSGADVVILDLVELVPEEAKPMAREAAREAIGAVAKGGAEVFVQADKEHFQADLSASVWPGLTGIVVPRLESAQEVSEAAGLLSQLEGNRGLPAGTLQIVAAVETAQGNLAAMDIAQASPRLWGITLGRADLVMDLRPEPSGEIHLMTYLMQLIITIANASGLVPLGAWWRSPARGLLAGPAATRDAAIRGRHIGFKGSLCVRPHQAGPLNQGFTPGAGEVEESRRLLGAFDDAERMGEAICELDGRIIGLPTAEAARHLIAHAQACAKMDEEKASILNQASQDSDHSEHIGAQP